MPIPNRTAILGVVLAGGDARRLRAGNAAISNKCFVRLAGKPLLDHVLERVHDQVGGLVLNANGATSQFAQWNLTVIPDLPLLPDGEKAGPMAGLLAGLEHALRLDNFTHIATFPCDTPCLPRNLVACLAETLLAKDADYAIAGSGAREHPVVGLWPLALAEPLARRFGEGLRAVYRLENDFKKAVAEFPDDGMDPFFNINEMKDLESLETSIRSGQCKAGLSHA
ncbi:MAG: molybdenum cofactor guanylyltransferase [Alphaproteobacteria bacterium]|nr:molybdenum cofactor guanylyltransferase [Alphaproteobacteria bacterium]